MKPTITILILIATLGSTFAQVERPDETDKTAIAAARITKNNQPVKWDMGDSWVLPDVKVLRIDGPWAEVEYSSSTPPPGVVQPGFSEKTERKRCWVNVNHVIRITTTEQAEKKSKEAEQGASGDGDKP